MLENAISIPNIFTLKNILIYLLIINIIGFYMTIIEARGGEFLLTDVYPPLEIFPVRSGVNLHMHCISKFLLIL